jgi:putative SOS response-associated peptidase YedK
MPAILRLEHHEAWLKGTEEEARAVLTQYQSDLSLYGARISAGKRRQFSTSTTGRFG